MIRPMREEDLKQAADLEKRYFSLPWSEKTLRESLERQEYVFLVAEEEGQIAGYAGLLQVMEEGDITNVVVDESCRGRGLGRGLVSRLLEEGKARDEAIETAVKNAINTEYKEGYYCVAAVVAPESENSFDVTAKRNDFTVQIYKRQTPKATETGAGESVKKEVTLKDQSLQEYLETQGK